MKIQISCHECFEENLTRQQHMQSPWQHTIFELEKWPYFEARCPNGHTSRYVLSNELYDVLFQQATYCIQDGYYRESIGTYHASLERFFEYCTEVLCYSINNQLDFSKTWKKIAHQSERQLGAYYILWHAILGSPPLFLDENIVKLRNQVIHQGKLVGRGDTVDYGRYVFDYIRNASQELKTKIGNEMSEYDMLRKNRIAWIAFEKEGINLCAYKPNEQPYSLGSILINSYLSDHKSFPDYDSCFKSENNNNLGFIK